MPQVKANGVSIEYEPLGEGEPLVLVMGIGGQLIDWPDGLCDLLVERGFRVIRFDNRDAGQSEQLEGLGVPPWRQTVARYLCGLPLNAPYTLVDMADDVAGLLDALHIDRAHVVGMSMGGMIAQCMAICHPHRLRTITSIASFTGERRLSVTTVRGLRALIQPPPRCADDAIENAVRFLDATGSTKFDRDDAAVRARAALGYERGHHPRGFQRQLAALLATGDRRAALRWVRTPALVVHGTADVLVRPVGGRVTAQSIPNARFRLIDGMGHDLPRGVWPILADAVAGHSRRSAA